jgi:hypothetical protein
MYANGVFYLNYQCQQASLSTIFIRVYHLNTLEAGLCYLPYGIACTIASFLTGEIQCFFFSNISFANRRLRIDN